MRVVHIIRKLIGESNVSIHRRRLDALLAGVEGLLRGGRLTLTMLGRSLGTRGYVKHGIKRIDRLLGNRHLHASHQDLYRPMVLALVADKQRPVILVDESSLGADGQKALLRASVPVGGRALAIYEEVHLAKRVTTPRVRRRFVERIKQLLPVHCRAVLVTDAGFRCPWFRMVEQLGFDWVGRVRHNTMVKTPTQSTWRPGRTLHAQATLRACDLGEASLARQNPTACRLVLVRCRAKGRVAYNHNRQRARRIRALRGAASAREPWLLATSLAQTSATDVVHLYRYRMQIEEGFRDLKTLTYGWGLQASRTRSIERLQVLLLIAALAALAVWLVGLCASEKRLQRRLQANTLRSRPVFSMHFLGCLVIKLALDRYRLSEFRAAYLALLNSVPALDLEVS